MKMYSLSCKNMGVTNCDFVAEGETKEEVMRMASEHFKNEHPEKAQEYMEKYTKEEMDQMMEDKMEEDM